MPTPEAQNECVHVGPSLDQNEGGFLTFEDGHPFFTAAPEDRDEPPWDVHEYNPTNRLLGWIPGREMYFFFSSCCWIFHFLLRVYRSLI